MLFLCKIVILILYLFESIQLYYQLCPAISQLIFIVLYQNRYVYAWMREKADFFLVSIELLKTWRPIQY